MSLEENDIEMADRYSLVGLEVTGHQPYGVLVRTDAGISGFVDRADISDVPIPPEDWPAIGSRAPGVVLGVTRQGKLRASLRPADVSLVEGVDDPRCAFAAWAKRGFADDAEKDAFFAAPGTPAILRWALCQHEPSSDRGRALEVVSAHWNAQEHQLQQFQPPERSRPRLVRAHPATSPNSAPNGQARRILLALARSLEPKPDARNLQ